MGSWSEYSSSEADCIRQVVSALAVDPSGARIATGSHDYDTKLWDFGGMDHRLKPFKSFEANGNYYVRLLLVKHSVNVMTRL